MNILLDIYLEKNLGDDLFLASVLNRYPNHNFFVFTQMDYSDFEQLFSNLKVIRFNKYYNYLLVKTGHRNKMLKREIKKYQIEALASVGGSIFIESDNWEINFKIREDLWSYFYNNNKPVYVIGSNFGPYVSNEFLHAYQNLLSKVSDVCFRDQASYDLFSHLENVRLAPDAIFSYQFEKKQTQKNTLGISVIDLMLRPDLAKYQKDYENSLVSLIKEGLSKGKVVYLLSFCKAEGDENQIQAIKDTYFSDESNVIPVYYQNNLQAYMAQFSSLERLIATRFHSIVLAMLFKIPFFALNYSKKSDNLLNDLKVPVEIKHIQKLNTINAEEMFDYMNVKDDISEIVKNSERQFLALDKLLN